MQYVIKSVGSVLKAVCECTEGSDRKYVISTTCFLFVFFLFFVFKKKKRLFSSFSTTVKDLTELRQVASIFKAETNIDILSFKHLTF